MSSNPSTLDQKKTVQQGEESSGTSPNNIKKPDAAGFGKQFIVTALQVLFYVGLIGSVGAYTVKTAVASSSDNHGCTAELFSNVRAKLANCSYGTGPTAPFASVAKTSAIAMYFRESFKNVFASNTSFIDTFSHLLGGLSSRERTRRRFSRSQRPVAVLPLATADGAPWATIDPPPLPAPGPMSIKWSADLMMDKSCSMIMMQLP